MKPTTPETPANKTNETDERLRRVMCLFARKLDSANGILNKHKVDLDANPSYAMEWSLCAFTAAAQINVYTQVYRALDNKDRTALDKLNGTIEFATKNVLMRASSPQRSTSPTASLLEQEMLAAWAKVVDLIRQEY
jgi:hypothetical protein